MKLDIRLVSPLEKVFTDEAPHGGYRSASALLGETASFQVAWSAPEGPWRDYVDMTVDCDADVTVRYVRSVPVQFITLADDDRDYLRTKPGLFPDVLDVLPPDHLRAYSYRWECMWIDIDNAKPGVHPIKITVKDLNGEVLGEEVFTLKVIAAELPEQTLMHTRWFHCDSICQYYGVEMWSERFWEICENFVRTYVKAGMNMILTPIHTPPLDTAVGGERMTCQLVDVYLGNDGFTFGFDRLERWVEMCKRCGVKYYEMAHLFTQWGAKHAPKIIADVCGEQKQVFGWDTDALCDEYRDFLHEYLHALCDELEKLGIKDCTVFHISDEPNITMLEDYRAAHDMAAHFLHGMPIIDALSSFEFYQTGAIESPVPSINHMDPFVEAKVPGLWTYYCIGQYKDVVNTFVAMPGQRVRMLGVQLYKYDLAGFLKWGYNFYNSQYSTRPINPWINTDCDGFSPAGDAYEVYPGDDGQAIESQRSMLCAEAMYDLRALRLLESLKGREYTMAVLEEGIHPITFTEYPRDAAWLINMRERVNAEIEKAVNA